MAKKVQIAVYMDDEIGLCYSVMINGDNEISGSGYGPIDLTRKSKKYTEYIMTIRRSSVENGNAPLVNEVPKSRKLGKRKLEESEFAIIRKDFIYA